MIITHICCSVDSHYFLSKLREEYKDDEIKGYYYNPNIHPYSEYYLRGMDVKRSCDILGIELIFAEYNYEEWLTKVKGLEGEPEKGDRCDVCYSDRLEHTAMIAKSENADKFTTTLLMSPKKSVEKLNRIGKNLSNSDIEFLTKEYKVGSGAQEQQELAKKDKLYRQDYCGCMFALNVQRDQSSKLAVELMSPVNRQVHYGSIEDRINLFEYRDRLELDSTPYDIVKSNIQNYRELSSAVILNGDKVHSKFLYYSFNRLKLFKARVEKVIGSIAYLNRGEAKIITIDTFNSISKNSYKDVKSLSFSDISIKDEVRTRFSLFDDFYDSSIVIVLDRLPSVDDKLVIQLNSLIYNDSVLKLKLLG